MSDPRDEYPVGPVEPDPPEEGFRMTPVPGPDDERASSVPPDHGFFCIRCGSSLKGVNVEGSCSSCGEPALSSFRPGAEVSHATNGYAIASMVCGILSLPGCMCYGLPGLVLGIVAIVLASISSKKIRAGVFRPTSGGMATSGMVMGIIGTILGLMYAGLMIFAFVSASMVGP